MTEVDLQKSFIEEFKSLSFVEDNNVAYPNRPFAKPQRKTWFEVYFLSDPPKEAGICEDSQNRYTGIFQIDICTPLGQGETKSNKFYKEIAKKFNRDTYFSDISVLRCYRAIQKAEEDCFRTVIRIEWTADIDKEK